MFVHGHRPGGMTFFDVCEQNVFSYAAKIELGISNDGKQERQTRKCLRGLSFSNRGTIPSELYVGGVEDR